MQTCLKHTHGPCIAHYDLSQTRKRSRHSANSSPEAHHMIDQPIVRGNDAV